MTTPKVEELIRDWADPDLNKTNLLLQLLERRLYHSYEPSLLPPNDQFGTRLDRWLENIPSGNSDIQKSMLKLAAELFYVGPDEFIELYRVAYNGPIARWLIDQSVIDIRSSNAAESLLAAVSETWFCPITDSMRINSFIHVNNISTKISIRPDWYSLAKLGDLTRITKYCQTKGIKRLVLLEDFVGSGSQIENTLDFAAEIGNGVQTLVVPLMICPAGVKTVQMLEKKHHGIIHFEPILSLPNSSFISENPTINEPPLHPKLRELANSTYAWVGEGKPPGSIKPYHPLGYPSNAPTGGLLVMYSNTPDNTLPLIHHRSNQWNPLFPRHCRE